jgi:uncharacterized Tic20 family protein
MTDPSAPNDPLSPPTAPPPLPPPASPDERMWAMFCHLAALAFFVLPAFGNVIGPLIVWIIKKDQYPLVDRHGKASLNFQLSMTIYAVAAGVISIPPMFLCPPIPLVTVGGLVLVGLICSVIAATQANDGRWFEYPLTIQFIK